MNHIDETADIRGSRIGDNVTIGRSSRVVNCTVEDGVVIQDNVVMEECAVKKDVVIHRNAWVKSGASIGEKTSLFNNVIIDENAKVGDDCTVWEHTSIGRNVKIKGGVTIGEFSTICQNVVVSADLPRLSYIEENVVVSSKPYVLTGLPYAVKQTSPGRLAVGCQIGTYEELLDRADDLIEKYNVDKETGELYKHIIKYLSKRGLVDGHQVAVQ